MVTVTDLRPPSAPDATVWDIAAAVRDPELPVLTIEDLGVLREAHVSESGQVLVTVTPTYSGCPAMDAIRDDVTAALRGAGYDDVSVRLVLSPAWTTDWLSDDGRTKLAEYGIAPPAGRAAAGPVRIALSVRCPRCSSPDTRQLARFGSTSCRALHVCNACREPFDYFKVH